MYVKNISTLVDILSIYNNLLLTNIVFLSYGCNFSICNDVKKTLRIKLNVKNSLMWLIVYILQKYVIAQ